MTSTTRGSTNPLVDPPRAPDFLIDRVVSGFSNDDAERHRALFDESGKQSLRDITTALAGIGRTVGEFPRILDFGCGCARVTRWLQFETTGCELFGCDIDGDAIAWNQENLPGVEFARNEHEPPLPYADESFDLILNHSVFTHIDERMQDLWLAELRRVLKPGGIALLSVHGTRAFAISEHGVRYEGDTPAIWRGELERRGILFISSDSYVGSSFPSFYHTTFHAPWYVFEHWAEWFDVTAYLSHADLGFQDIVLLQRDDREDRERGIGARPLAENATTPAGDPLASVGAVDGSRVPPVVAVALERIGERVSRLEAAMAKNLSQ
jgi:SAM-dependent methyltransferase